MNMYACRKVIKTSSIIKMPIKLKQPENANIDWALKVKQKEMNNLINICPANILENNRIAKLIGLIK